MSIEIGSIISLLVYFLAFSSFAQTVGSGQNISNVADTSGAIAAYADRQDDRLDKIVQLEKYLDSERSRIFNLGLAPDFFLRETYKTISELSPVELKALLEGDISKTEDSESRQRAAAILSRVAQFSATHENYQKQLDQMTLLELDYFIEGTMVAMQSLHGSLEVERSISAKDLTKIRQLFALAANEYQRYVRHHLEIGDPRDGPNRTDAYRSYFAVAKNYFDFTAKVAAPTTIKIFWERIRNKTRTLFTFLKTMIQVGPAIIEMGFKLWRGTSPLTGSTSVTDSIDKVFRKIGKVTGHTVKILGSENLPANSKPDGKTVYLLTPTHRDPIRDGIIMANLGISNYLLAMATDQMAPKYWADKLTENDNIVTVGRGSGLPIEKILRELKRGVTDKILIYPEGSVSAGLYETRPLREKFSWGLIDALIKEGYDVKLIPITYQNSGQFVHRNTVAGFFKYIDGNPDRELVVKVSPAVDSKALTLLAKSTKSTAIGHFIRATWLQGLPHNEEFNNAILRVNAAAREFKSELGISLLHKTSALQCRRLFQ